MKIKTLITAATLSFCSLSAMATVPSVQPVINQAQPNSPAHAQQANQPSARHDGVSRGQKAMERRGPHAQKHDHKHQEQHTQKHSERSAQRASGQMHRHNQAVDQHRQARFAPKAESSRQGRSHFVWVED